MNEDEYENYTDDDYLAELQAYVADSKKEREQDEAERHEQLADMVGGFLGVWWYMRSFSAATSRNIRTYAAVADREAKVKAWQDSGNSKQKVRIINEFGACPKCLPFVGGVYPLEDAYDLVPFHYNCRCTFVHIENDSSGNKFKDVALVSGLETAKAKLSTGKENDITDEELQLLAMDYVKDFPDKVVPAQNRHIPGSENYKLGKSILDPKLYKKIKNNSFDYSEIEKLYNEYKGTGHFKVRFDRKNHKINNVQETINTNKIIGIDVKGDVPYAATGFKIHYSAKGYHIVPWRSMNQEDVL